MAVQIFDWRLGLDPSAVGLEKNLYSELNLINLAFRPKQNPDVPMRKNDPLVWWFGAKGVQAKKGKTMRASLKTILLSRIPKSIAACAALVCLSSSLQAQISVGSGGVGPIVFAAEPPLPASEWATTNITVGNAATYKSPTAVDAGAQTLDAFSIIDPLQRTNANGTARFACHRTNSTTYLFTQPTGVPVSVIKATLRNNSGGAVNAITVSYDYSIPVTPVTDEAPGQRVFYSFDGLPNNWQPIDGLSGKTAAQLLTAGITLISPWADGSDLFLLWVDDNNETGTDGLFTIDNFTVRLGLPPCPGITNNPSNVTVTECTVNSVSFSVATTGAVSSVQWERDSGSGFTAIAGANNNTYTLTPVVLGDSGSQFRAVVTGSGTCIPINSGAATLTVNEDNTPPSPVAALTYNLAPNISASSLTNITIIFNEPISTTTTNNPDWFGALLLVDTNTSQQVEIFFDVNWPNSRTAILHTVPLDPTHGYTLQMEAVFDACGENEMLLTNIPVYSFTRNLLERDASTLWQYNQSNVNLGTAWAAPAYDSSTWLTGAGPFDAKTGAGFAGSCSARTTIAGEPIRTCLSLSNETLTAEIPTYYFRKQFNYTGDTNVVLQLRSILDDGMVVHLNGAEIFRLGMASGTVEFTTPANRTVGDGSRETNFVVATLREGVNTIAVEVHNVNLTGSDITFGLAVDAISATASAIEPVMSVSQSGASVTVSWVPPIGTLQGSLDISSPANWFNIPGATSPFTTNAPPAIQFFRVTVP